MDLVILCDGPRSYLLFIETRSVEKGNIMSLFRSYLDGRYLVDLVQPNTIRRFNRLPTAIMSVQSIIVRYLR